jgi:hypothetical protein
MSDIAIRPVQGQEMLDILYILDSYAFRPTPPFPERAGWEARVKARVGTQYYAVFEGGEAVAITACPPLMQNVRGAMVKMGGYADVSTHPKARRKGYVRQLMRYGHEHYRSEGRAFSCLYPFRESFYERMGYVTFPQSRQIIFKADQLLPLLKSDLGGEFEFSLIGEGYGAYVDFVREMQPRVHGMAVFEYPQEATAKENRAWLLQAKVDGRLAGLMVYTIRDGEMMNYTLHATRFYHRTSQGKYLLLQWLARHVDQAGNVRLWVPAYEQPNTWFADIRPKLEPAFVAPMGRVLDVAAIGGMEVGPGSYTAAISDPDCPWNDGTWRFEEAGGKLRVSRTRGAVDCALCIQGLSALVYGVNDPEDFPIRGWGAPSAETAAAMRTMFPSRLPYLHEHY